MITKLYFEILIRYLPFEKYKITNRNLLTEPRKLNFYKYNTLFQMRIIADRNKKTENVACMATTTKLNKITKKVYYHIYMIVV